MKKLLTLPPNLVDCFHDITGLNKDDWFCTNDPVGRKLGSAGGTTNVLLNCYSSEIESQNSLFCSSKQPLLPSG